METSSFENMFSSFYNARWWTESKNSLILLTLVHSAPVVLKFYTWDIQNTSCLPVDACLGLCSFGEGCDTAPSFFIVVFHPSYHNSLLLNTWPFQIEQVHLRHILCHDNHVTNATEHVACNTEGPCCLSLCYQVSCIYVTKLVKNYMCMLELHAVTRDTSVDYEFPYRKWFPSGLYVPLCCSPLLLAPPSTSCISCHTFSHFLCDGWEFTAPAAAMTKEHSCSTATCLKKWTSYNIQVKLDVAHCKKSGKHGIGIAYAVPILNMMIHTILNVYKIERNALLKPFKFVDYTP
jgi:hypothetical protein